MKRLLLAGLLLLTGVATMQGLSQLSLPYIFAVGTKLSASEMNANLDAVAARLDPVRTSVRETRNTQITLSERVDRAMLKLTASRQSEPGSASSLQQSGDMEIRVRAGELAHPHAVNEVFRGFASAMDATDELTRQVLQDLAVISARLTDAESQLGLLVQVREEAEVAEYSTPAHTVFRPNERIYPAPMMANFTAVITSLVPLEANAAEVADWLAHELARIASIEAVLGTDEPGAPEGVFQATAGYRHLRTTAPLAMYFLFRFEPEGRGQEATVTVTGPDGWGYYTPGGWETNKPLDLGTFGSGVHEQLAFAPPVDGDYTITASIGGQQHSVTSTVDLSLRLPAFEDVVVTALEDRVTVSWSPVAGAKVYRVEFRDPPAAGGQEPRFAIETHSTTVTFPITRSEIVREWLPEYKIDLLARSHDVNAPNIDYNSQMLESIESFSIPPWF